MFETCCTHSERLAMIEEINTGFYAQPASTRRMPVQPLRYRHKAIPGAGGQCNLFGTGMNKTCQAAMGSGFVFRPPCEVDVAMDRGIFDVLVQRTRYGSWEWTIGRVVQISAVTRH